MIVSNTSPLIYLGKRGFLSLLHKCFNKIIIPDTVYSEVNFLAESIEAIAMKKAIIEKWLSVENIKINDSLNESIIQKGEKEAISLALKYKSKILLDDDVAKYYASVFGLEPHGTLYVLHLSFIKKFISKERVKEILDLMIADGFYISTELYAEFLDLLNYK